MPRPVPPGAHPARTRFRSHSLDGARLYFHPETGTHVRVATTATSGERRSAPRVVMFGITNACNLRCDFCSRDAARPSLWTVGTAIEALSGLCRAGSLEVAFGGGEPFAFRGFDELVAELHRQTPLAIHVTTNGTLLDAQSWPRFAGRLGQVRISLYDRNTYRRCAELMASTGQRWGANLLVDDQALPGLPAWLAELAAAGCHDVSLLSYVGAGAERRLGQAGRARLADVIKDSPLPCRLSVCFGDQVPVPRLYAGFDNDGDCGAGRDFVTVTPDQRVQSCSFQDHGVPARTAAEILAAWRQGDLAWRQPAARSGCARLLPQAAVAPPLPPVAVWQGFSGNNSGECVLVAKFQTVDDAERYLADLLPGEPRESGYPEEWRALFHAEQVAVPGMDSQTSSREVPGELVSLGRSVFALGYGADDSFPELRALAWRRGAYVVPGGVHVHEPLTLLVAVRGTSQRDVAQLAERGSSLAAHHYRYGETLLLALPLSRQESPLAAARDEVLRLAAGRPVAAEITEEPITEQAMVEAIKHLGEEPARRSRLLVSFWSWDESESAEWARQFVQGLPALQAVRAGRTLLFDFGTGSDRERKRLAVLAYRRGASVWPLDGEEVKVCGRFWLPPPEPRKGTKAEPPRLDTERLDQVLRAGLPPRVAGYEFGPETESYRPSTRVLLRTKAPSRCLEAVRAAAAELACRMDVSVLELDPLGAALRRLQGDLRGQHGS